jgi:hypothetical protein
LKNVYAFEGCGIKMTDGIGYSDERKVRQREDMTRK